MHVLLITSEDLNEKNTLGSIFELSQAKALQSKGIKTAILAVGYYSSSNVLKALLYRLLKKEYGYYRFQDLSFFELVGRLVQSLRFSLTQKTVIRKLKIQGVIVYEALFHRIHFRLNEKGNRYWVQHGYDGFNSYTTDKGEPDIIHAHSRFLLAGLLAEEIAKTKKINYVLTEHSTFFSRGLVNSYQVPLVKKIIEHSKKYIVVSSNLGLTVNRYLNTSYPFKIIPNIIDTIFEEPIDNETDKSTFCFLNIATLNAKKNHKSLIRAFAQEFKNDKKIFLRIGGEGEEQEGLISLVNDLDLQERVIFLGKLSHENVKKEMMKCNVFVLSSLTETFGVVLIEALSCGKPVISTKSGGPDDIITRDNGILITVNDDQALSKAMREIYDNYHLYNSNKIRQDCLNKYGSNAITDQLINLYNEVLTTDSDNQH
jgi:glycosyltransferase involved in cell wall biosynthesis